MEFVVRAPNEEKKHRLSVHIQKSSGIYSIPAEEFFHFGYCATIFISIFSFLALFISVDFFLPSLFSAFSIFTDGN